MESEGLRGGERGVGSFCCGDLLGARGGGHGGCIVVNRARGVEVEWWPRRRLRETGLHALCGRHGAMGGSVEGLDGFVEGGELVLVFGVLFGKGLVGPLACLLGFLEGGGKGRSLRLEARETAVELGARQGGIGGGQRAVGGIGGCGFFVLLFLRFADFVRLPAPSPSSRDAVGLVELVDAVGEVGLAGIDAGGVELGARSIGV